ncbi:MAG: hypothetical protein GXP41_10235 [Chloroflexi bacterium]|nr:hypothetical protein [Chloroflexota bacterium]
MAKKSRKKRARKGNAKVRRPSPSTKRAAPQAASPASGNAAAKKTKSGAATAAYSVNALQRTAPQPKQAATRTSTPDYATEYAYVYQDLRRIALLAGSFLVVMIALTFVLH